MLVLCVSTLTWPKEIEDILEELRRENGELRELLRTLADGEPCGMRGIGARSDCSSGWRADSDRQHQDLLNTVRETAQQQVPFNVGRVSAPSPLYAIVTDCRLVSRRVQSIAREGGTTALDRGHDPRGREDAYSTVCIDIPIIGNVR